MTRSTPTLQETGLAIVIPTCDRTEHLRRCLSALQFSVYEVRDIGVNLDVLVTDDGAVSAREVVASFPWARWVPGPRTGPSSNRNAGVRLARGSWILFLDDDVIPDPGLLRAYVDAISRKSADVLEGRVVSNRPQRAFNELSPLNPTGGALWSCNFAIRRSIFDDIDGFDEAFPCPGMEDTDLRLRLLRSGSRTTFLETATVCHPWRRIELREVLARYRNLDLFLDRHPEETSHYDWRWFARGVGHLLKELGRNFVMYRGRGAGFQVGDAAIAGIISVRLWRRARACS